MTAYDDYLDFCFWHVRSGDVDPVYPVLGHLHWSHCPTEEDEVAFTLLYVAYYNLSSALAAWFDGWRPGMALTEAQLRYPTGTERRAHRDVRQFAKHIASLNAIAERYSGLIPYLRTADWQTGQQRLTDIYGNGRWAGYKTGEIFSTVHGWRAKPPDAGHAHSSGPRKGLADLFPETAALIGNDAVTVKRLDALTDMLCEATNLPVEQVETTLCDWHSTLKGAYYVGHDIDQQQEQYQRSGRDDVKLTLTEARRAVFDPGWLGEVQGWNGVRKPLNRLYIDTGKIRWWE